MEIYVFGSNLAGTHGIGAARLAARFFGAERGVGEGPTGCAYAIPTRNGQYRVRSLQAIARSVERFRRYALQHPEHTFVVSRVGVGREGYSDTQMSALFRGMPGNVRLPEGW